MKSFFYYRKRFRHDAGFTLVELMLALAILGLLTAIGGVEYQQFMTRARYNRAKSELGAMSTMIQGYRVTVDETLFQIMAPDACLVGDQGCSAGAPVSTCGNIAYGNPFWQRIGYNSNPVDPWGNFYLMDQNEGELNWFFTGPNGEDCRNDAVWTAGADGIWEGAGLTAAVSGDDLIMRVPFYSNPPCPPSFDSLPFEGGE